MKFKTFLLVIAALCFFSCEKKNASPIGKWETVTTTNFFWHYSFDDRANACKELPKMFPGTRFCFDYEVSNSSFSKVILTIYGQTKETWEWTFLDDDNEVADVLVYSDTASVASQRFILKKIE